MISVLGTTEHSSCNHCIDTSGNKVILYIIYMGHSPENWTKEGAAFPIINIKLKHETF